MHLTDYVMINFTFIQFYLYYFQNPRSYIKDPMNSYISSGHHTFISVSSFAAHSWLNVYVIYIHFISTTWVWCELEISYAVYVITGHFAYHISLPTSSRTRHWALLPRFLSSITCRDNGSSSIIIYENKRSEDFVTSAHITLILSNHSLLDR
jgi:hypothetical protein